MRKFLVSAAIIGLVAGSPAIAQEHHDQGGQPHGEPHSNAPRGGGAPHGGPGQRPQGGPERGGASANRGPQQGRPEANRPGPAMRPTPGNAMRGPQGRPAPNNAMRGPSRNFSSFRNYHQNFNAARRFRAAPYRPPPGYYARRWAWGMTLPALFWSRQYWLMNYAAYDLPPPPFGAIWVRVGSDALLIDQSSGMIISVSYGVFY